VLRLFQIRKPCLTVYTRVDFASGGVWPCDKDESKRKFYNYNAGRLNYNFWLLGGSMVPSPETNDLGGQRYKPFPQTLFFGTGGLGFFYKGRAKFSSKSFFLRRLEIIQTGKANSQLLHVLYCSNNFFVHTLITYLLKITAITRDDMSSTFSVLALELPDPTQELFAQTRHVATTFTCFTALPTELRWIIWRRAFRWEERCDWTSNTNHFPAWGHPGGSSSSNPQRFGGSCLVTRLQGEQRRNP